MTLTLRRYEEADRQACLDVFGSNIPHFFAELEKADFADFLTNEATLSSDYFVVEKVGATAPLGCGGVYVVEDVAGFCWGMVERAQHRQGVGSFLLKKRLEHLRRHYPEITAVNLDTSQHSRGFFARFGFEVTQITADSYAPGLDRYDMTLSRERLAKLVSGF